MNRNRQHPETRSYIQSNIENKESVSFTSFFSSKAAAIVRLSDRIIVSSGGIYIPFVLFFSALSVNTYLWDNQKDAVLESIRNQLKDQLSSIIYPIQGRIRAYEQILYGVNGYFQATSGYINPDSFRKYVSESDILKNYPEISGISISYYQAYSTSRGRVSSAPVMYIEPSNTSVLGFDNFSDSHRTYAMKQAQERAVPVLSSPVRLLQQTSNDGAIGYIMFHSIFQPNRSDFVSDERKRNTFGWSAVAFQASDLIQQASSRDFQGMDLSIYDGTQEHIEKLLFGTSNVGNKQGSHLAISVRKTVDIGNREWTFVLSSTEEMEQKMFHKVYLDSVLRSGIIISLILTISSFVIIRTRRESLETLCRMAGKDNTIAEMGSHDALTGLPNRIQFMKWIEKSIEEVSINKKSFAVMFVDLDEFKTVNDTSGHHYGDELLRQVAGRLSENIRESDIVARQGGDEFMVGISDLRTMEDAELVAMQIIRSLEKPFMVFDDELRIGSSIGVVIYPTHTQDVGLIQTFADIAMYDAKNSGKNTVRVFSDEMQKGLNEKRKIQDALHYAIDKNELFLHYQPIVDTKTKEIVAMETLIRWNHPSFGLIPPSKFIPIAEQNGNLIREVGLWTFRRLCEQIARWKRYNIVVPKMNYNLSISQLRSKNIHEYFFHILQEYGIHPSEIEIEITESMLVDGVQHAMETIQKLADAGFSIALDDFGTGFSSLAYLGKLKLDTLKIDKSFVDNITESDDDKGVVHAIITLAHGLGKKVVAEGVETKEQYELLRQMGCDFIQGYYFGKPENTEITTQRIYKGINSL